MVMLAFAIMPSKDTDSMCWFLQLCALHGTDMDCALFTDQGPLLSAVRQLSSKICVKFSLMLCLQHLIRNVRHKFPDLIKCDAKAKLTIQTNMDNAADAENMVMFFDAINDMITGLIEVGADIPTVVDMAFCVLRVHPSHWTVFGNAPTFVHHNCKKMVCEFLGPLKAIHLFSEEMDRLKEEGIVPNFSVLHSSIEKCNIEGNAIAKSFE